MSKLTDENISNVIDLMNEVKFKSVKDNFNIPIMNIQKRRKNNEKKDLKQFYCNYNFYLAFNDAVITFVCNSLSVDFSYCPQKINSQRCTVLDQFIKQYFSTNLPNIINDSDRNDVKQLLYNIRNGDSAYISKLHKTILNIVSRVFNNYFESCRSNYIAQVNSIGYNFCQTNCREGLIKSSGIGRYLYKFNGNYFLYDFNSSSYIAGDNRKLRWLFKAMPMFNIPCNLVIDEPLIINDVLKIFADNEDNLPPCLYTDNIYRVKFELLNLLLKLYYGDNLTADNFKELVKKYDISNDVERCGIERNKNIIVKQINFAWDFHGSNGFENNNIARFGKLLKILFMVTNGNKQCLDNLSKVVAGIILGPTVCKKFDLNIKQCSVVTTNNKTFMTQFLQSIFLIGNSTRGKDNRDQIKELKTWGITDYTLNELSNPKNTGHFLEDKLYSRFVNITMDCENVKDGSYLKKLLSGELVDDDNEYLGKQKLESDTHYVFVVSRKEEAKSLQSIDYNEVNLSQDIPKDIVYFDKSSQLSDWEKAFILINLAEYGLKLLLETDNKKQEPVLKISDPVEFFTKQCCEEKTVTDEDKPDATNATAMCTLAKTYNLFYGIVDKKYQLAEDKFNKNIGKEYNFPYRFDNTNRKNDVIKRDLKNGYDITEVLKKDSKGNACIGLVIKPKEEIIEIANKIADTKKSNQKIFTEREFIKFIGEIGDLYFDDSVIEISD